MSEPTERVPVRIAVAVDRNGFWSAVTSCAFESNEEAAQAAMDCAPLQNSPARHVVWVNAEVPLPACQIVCGGLESGDQRRPWAW